MRLFIVFKMQLFLVVFNCVADRDNFFQIAISCDVAFVVARREEREAVQSTVLLSGGDVETILSIKGMRKSLASSKRDVEDICQSVDISRQENKITHDRVSEVHEQEESRSMRKDAISYFR